jgi:CheY-like chemotaxis protein
MLSDSSTPTDSNGAPMKRVLVVDDDRFFRMLLESTLSKQFVVSLAASGEEALALCAESLPDLIVMDIEMGGGMDGFKACRKIREISTVPVIFATSHNSLDFQLDAFDAGASDIVGKPVSQPLLLRKAVLAIEMHSEAQRLQEEKQTLQNMAMNFLSTVGENGVLMNFIRSSIQCRSYEELAGKVVEATRELGLQSFGVIRHGDEMVSFRTDGQPSSLEADILGKLSSMGRIFQFKKQLVVNYDHVSIAVTNLPEDSPERVGSIKDYLAILAETAEALCDNVGMRQESTVRAEQLQVALIGAVSAVESLRARHVSMLSDTRLLLQELIDNVEKTFSWLGATTEQEKTIANTMDYSVQRILDLISTRGQYDTEFEHVLSAMRGNQQSSGEADFF